MERKLTPPLSVRCGRVLAHRRGRYPGAGPSTNCGTCRYSGTGPSTNPRTCRYPGAGHTVTDYAADSSPCPASTDPGAGHTITDYAADISADPGTVHTITDKSPNTSPYSAPTDPGARSSWGYSVADHGYRPSSGVARL